MSLENVLPEHAHGPMMPPEGIVNAASEELLEMEVDLLAFAVENREVPHARWYRVRIDCESVRLDTRYPKGELLLENVGKRPCAYEVIAEFAHCENQVVEPHESIDLRTPGLKGFMTAHREIVEIFFGQDPVRIERGKRTVAEILRKVGKTPEAYILLEEKCGQPPMPIPANQPVEICGCEEFHTQVQSGGSS